MVQMLLFKNENRNATTITTAAWIIPDNHLIMTYYGYTVIIFFKDIQTLIHRYK